MIAFADDHTLKLSCRPSKFNEDDTINHLEECLLEVHTWMECNRLKLNTSKTEFIHFGSRQPLTKCTKGSVQVTDDSDTP